MQWRREFWLAVLVIGTGTFAAGERILAASDEPGLVTPVLVIGVVTAPMAFYAACRGHRVRFTLPAWVVVVSVAAAAVLGSAMAGLLRYPVLTDLGPVATVSVAVVRESSLLLVPLAVLFALPTRRASDGLLIGAAAGAGFAVAETVGYLVTAPDVVGPTAHAVLVRGLLAPAAQLAWGGIAAAALWLAAQEHWNARALRRLVLAVGGVIALHALWEGVDGVSGRAALTVVNLLLLGWVLRTTSRRVAPTRVLGRRGAPAAGGPSVVGGPSVAGGPSAVGASRPAQAVVPPARATPAPVVRATPAPVVPDADVDARERAAEEARAAGSPGSPAGA